MIHVMKLHYKTFSMANESLKTSVGDEGELSTQFIERAATTFRQLRAKMLASYAVQIGTLNNP